jgi:serine/threonine protein kinase
MNVLHRDLKMPNILVHFKNVEQNVIFNEPAKLKQIKKEGQLLGNVDVVIADLGFAKEL